MNKLLILTITVFTVLFYNCGQGTKHNAPEHETAIDTGLHLNENEPDHTVLTLKKQKFAFVIRTGGRIMADSRDIEIITAKSSGIIKFYDHTLLPGVKVVKGQRLFVLAGEQLAEGNPELRLLQVRADLEKASANFERKKSLYDEKIITQEDFLEAKNEYEKISNEYNNLSSTAGSSGNIVYSPGNGYLRDLFVNAGQMVAAGQAVASIAKEHNLILKADIPADHLDKLPLIEKANFTVGHSKRIFKTDEMNGTRISSGRSIGDNSFYIPVFFRFDYDRELIDGTFAEVYLIGKESDDVLVVPNSALMEEYGKLYVFVEDDDGDFMKRYITAGYNDGEFTEVAEGLEENEKIVATGAYNIKLSMMNTSAPAQSHNH